MIGTKLLRFTDNDNMFNLTMIKTNSTILMCLTRWTLTQWCHFAELALRKTKASIRCEPH